MELATLKNELSPSRAVPKTTTRLIPFGKSGTLERILVLTRCLRFLTINDYHVRRVLGVGCNAAVFHCEVLLNNKPFSLALKMIFNFGQWSPNELEQYNNEKILLKLTSIHPNINYILCDFIAQPTAVMLNHFDPSIRDILTNATGEAIPTQFFVFEYHSMTLEEKLIELGAQISLEKILEYSLQIIDCFLFLFNNHIIHGDVKLNNILISEDDRIILTDFGESVELDASHRCQYHKLGGGGNPRHKAPEVLNAMSQSWSNRGLEIELHGQYSWEVGCLLFQISFGEFPFANYPRIDKLSNIEVPPVEFPDHDGDKIPTALT